MLTIKVGFETYGGYGTRQGSQQTLRRFLTQCDNAGGTIEINGSVVTLSTAEAAYTAQLDDVIADDVRVIEVSGSDAVPGVFVLQLVA